jgi:hypothetical protein
MGRVTKQFFNDAIGRSSGISVIGRNAVLFRGDRANHLSGAAREGRRKIAPRRLPKVFRVNSPPSRFRAHCSSRLRQQ